MTRPPAWIGVFALAALPILEAAPTAAQSAAPAPTAAAAPTPAAAPAPIGFETQARFAAWISDFKREAVTRGVNRALLDRVFAGVRLNAKVMELDKKQAEFTKPIWEYLAGMVSETRIENGRAQAAALAPLLPRLERSFGVDPAVALAIWGVESNFGKAYGDYNVIESLATLAFEGRRAGWARGQLIEAFLILQNGDITPDRMKGSWAGAMGHTQFIPTSFTAYAVDFTGDGKRDLWGEDPADALASTANYLMKSKWRPGEPAFVEVATPPGADPAMFDESIRRTVADWAAMGVRSADGRPLPNLDEAAIIQPAGARGPSFMIFRNFAAIRRYNNATSYALAVAHLAERIKGGGPFVGRWPEGERTLTRSEIEETQRLLMAMGFDPKGVDGQVGPGARAAIRAFQQSQGIPADGYPSVDVLNRLRAAAQGGPRPAPAPLPAPAPMAAPAAAPPTPAPMAPVAAPGDGSYVGPAPEEVAAVQRRLAERGFGSGPADGIWSAPTQAAVATFAAARGLPFEGRLTPEIMSALGL